MRLKLIEQNLVLLPGLDGTGLLFGPFQAVLPPEFSSTIVSYPRDETLTLKQSLSHIGAASPERKPFVLVAESVSGPLALEYAATYPDDVSALVLVSSFVSNPLPSWLKVGGTMLPDFVFKRSPSDDMLRKFFLGEDCSDILLTTLQQAIASVSPKVLARRVRDVFSTDARVALQNCRKPILYLMAGQDKILGKRGWETMIPFRPNITTTVLDGPHLLLQRKPRECFTAIEKFLKTIDAATGCLE